MVAQSIPLKWYPYDLLIEMAEQARIVSQRLQEAAPLGQIVVASMVAGPFLAPFANSKGGAYPHSPERQVTPGLAFIYYSTNYSVDSRRSPNILTFLLKILINHNRLSDVFGRTALLSGAQAICEGSH